MTEIWSNKRVRICWQPKFTPHYFAKRLHVCDHVQTLKDTIQTFARAWTNNLYISHVQYVISRACTPRILKVVAENGLKDSYGLFSE
jgi:hypothetical protein